MSITALKSFCAIAICLVASTGFSEIALAGVVYPPVGVPGPIVGVGLPVAAVVWGGYWVVRKLRSWNRLR
jgi:hypothetical protein